MKKQDYDNYLETIEKPISKYIGSPIIGHLFNFFKNPFSVVRTGVEKEGWVFSLNVANKKFIVMAGPEALSFLVQGGPKYFSNKEIWAPYINEFKAVKSLSTLDGPEHLQLRKVTGKGYSLRSLDGQTEAMTTLVKSELAPYIENGYLKVNPFCKSLVTEQLGKLLAGQALGENKDHMLRFLRTSLNVHIYKIWPKFLLKMPGFKKSKKRILKFSDEVIETHRNTLRETPDLIDDILEYFDNNPGSLTKEELTVSVLSPFIAGIDTAANVLASTLYCLQKNPKVLEKLQSEIDLYFKEKTPSMADLRKRDYTRGVIMETLRHYPLAPMLIRHSAKSFNFKGYKIPQGSDLLIPTALNHFDEKYFKNPKAFEPERFLEPRSEHKKPFIYSPYGVGAHICQGNNLAEAMLMLNIGGILNQIKILPNPNQRKVKFKYVPTTCPGDNFKLKVSRKN